MTQRMQSQYVQFYTHGSTAQKVVSESAPKKALPEWKEPRQKVIRRLRILVDPVAIFGMVVAICMLITLTVGMIRLHNTAQEVVQMEQYVKYQQWQNRDARARYTASYDLEQIEKTALALGMVPADQVEHRVIDISVTPAVEEPTVWERVGTFLTGLFA